jgi:hypothetical protein
MNHSIASHAVNWYNGNIVRTTSISGGPTKQGHMFRIWHLYGIVSDRHMLLPYEPYVKNETLKYEKTIWLSHMPLPPG